MKILCTGAAGYIGSVLVPILLRAGHEVVALDLYPSGIAPLAFWSKLPQLTLVRADVTDVSAMPAHYEAADVIIPLAGIVGAPACDCVPAAAVAVNHLAIEFALRHAKGKVIYPTTNSGYGIGGEELCTESSPLKPVSLYGRTKMAAEEAVLAKGGISLRLATVFGQSPSFRRELLVNDFTYRAVKDRALVVFEGHHRRNFIAVRDVAKAFVHAIENYDKMSGQAFNVGLSSANLTKLELCERIKAQVPDFVYLESAIGRDPDQRNYVVSNSKLEATGWSADCTLEDGISELIRSFV